MKIINFKDRRVRLITFLGLLTAVFLAIKIYIVLNPLTPNVILTVPTDQAQGVALNSEIKITFDQEIPQDGWQAVPSPGISAINQISKNEMIIKPGQPLTPSTHYQIEITNPKFKKFFYRFSFTTASPPSPEVIIYGRGDSDFYEKSEKFYQEKYPLLHFLSENPSFFWSLDYTGPLKLEVQLVKDTPAIRKEVLGWIASHQVNPTTHQITWKVRQ